MKRKVQVLAFLLFAIQFISFAQNDSIPVITHFPETDTLDNQRVYRIADKMPEFPQGQALMFKYIRDNLKHPVIGYDDWTGTLYITFVVDTTGKIRNACIYQRVPHDKADVSEYEKQSLRLVNEMPPWIPGILHGEKVYARYVLPIRFSIK